MRRAVRVLLLAAGVAVLAALVVRTGAANIAAMLRTVGWGFLVVSAIYAAHVAVRAAALWRSMIGGPPETGHQARVPRYLDVLFIRLAGEAVEMLTLTGPFLAEPAKGYLLKRQGISGAHAYGAVAIEYLLYTLVASWMAAVALSMLLARDLLPHGMRGPVIGIVVAMGAFTVGCAWAATSGIGLVAPIVRLVVAPFDRDGAARIGSRISDIERVLVDFMHEHPARLAEVLLVEAAGHALLASEIWVVLRSLRFPMTAVEAFLVEGGEKFINAAFFFIPGQVGASEGVYALLVAAVGYPVAAGVTLSLVRRVRALIVAGAGVGVLAINRRLASAPPDRTPTR